MSNIDVISTKSIKYRLHIKDNNIHDTFTNHEGVESKVKIAKENDYLNSKQEEQEAL